MYKKWFIFKKKTIDNILQDREINKYFSITFSLLVLLAIVSSGISVIHINIIHSL